MFDSSIQFDAEAHSYTVDGDRYDSVTQILRELSARVYRFVDAGVMAEAAWLGQAVHKVIELDILGALDEGELDPRLLPYLGLLNGEAALVDAKRCASVPRTAGPQTAGYEIALRECMPDVVARAASGPGAARINRFALHLTPSETRGWTLVPFKNPNDARVFLSALTTHNWSKAA
jgi:hypothetical protein